MLNAIEADALADGVTEFAIATRYRGADDATHTVSRPIICRIEDRGIAVVEVENEANKVDINSATEEQLAALFASFGSTSVQAEKAASAVHRFRAASIDGSTTDGHPTDGITEMKGARFDSVMELDQVPFLTREMFTAVVPFVTVTPSLLAPERPEPTTGHPSAAPFSARKGQVVWPEPQPATMPILSSAARSDVSGVFLVHVELATTRGARSTREAVIVETGSGRRPYTVEWRKGRERYQGFIASANVPGSSGVVTKSYPPCWVNN